MAGSKVMVSKYCTCKIVVLHIRVCLVHAHLILISFSVSRSSWVSVGHYHGSVFRDILNFCGFSLFNLGFVFVLSTLLSLELNFASQSCSHCIYFLKFCAFTLIFFNSLIHIVYISSSAQWLRMNELI